VCQLEVLAFSGVEFRPGCDELARKSRYDIAITHLGNGDSYGQDLLDLNSWNASIKGLNSVSWQVLVFSGLFCQSVLRCPELKTFFSFF